MRIGSVYVIRFFFRYTCLSDFRVFLLLVFFLLFSRATRIKLFNDFSCCCFAVYFSFDFAFCLAVLVVFVVSGSSTVCHLVSCVLFVLFLH